MKFVLQILIYCLGVFHVKAQNVGIGTNTPTEKLEVLGNIKGVNLLATGSLSLTNISSPTTWTLSINTINNYLSVSKNGASIMTITTEGRVGIGVATPGYTLEVAGSLNAISAFFDGSVTTDGNMYAHQSVSVDGSVYVDGGVNAGGNITVNNGYGIMRNANSSTQLKYFTFTSPFTFTTFAGHTVAGPYQVNFPAAANFTSAPRVMTANYTYITGTAGHLFSIIPAIYSVTSTGFQIYFYNSSTSAATMDFTLSFVCIGN